MSQKGKNNSNFRHGRYINPTCECGRKKDARSSQCAICANKSYPVGGFDRDKIVRESIQTSDSYTEAAKKAGCTRSFIAKFVKIKNLDVSHMRPGRNREQDNSEIFTLVSKRINGTVRIRILRDKLIEYRCDKCKCGSVWQGEELTLQLEHRNGNPLDNRLENLMFLCPNCHSQTPTYAGKNSAGVSKERR